MADQSAARPRRRLLPALLEENAEFRTYWTGQTISLFGDQITALAVPLLAVLVLRADARQMGYLVAAGLAPYLLFSLHAGAWVDRRGRRRRIMIAADIGRAVLLTTVPAAAALGVLTIGHVYAVMFLMGTLTVLFSVSSSTLFVSLLPRNRYVEGNALLHGSRGIAHVGGPGLAGVLVQALSAPAALLADAASFLASALFLARIAPVEPPAADQRQRGLLLDGPRFIAQSAIIRSALAATATLNFFNYIFWALFVLYATRVLRVQPGLLGAVVGAGMLGTIAGSTLSGRWGRCLGIGRLFVLGTVVYPLPLMLVPAATGPALAILGFLFAARFGSGIGLMILDISIGSIFAAVIPDRMRARVSGAYSFVNWGIRALGSLAGGWLGSTLGLRPTLWIATAGALAGVLWLLPSPMLRLRTLDGTGSEETRQDTVAPASTARSAAEATDGAPMTP